MGLLQNTSPTQDQGWNLADELNMDWSSGALFDDLPSRAKALRGDEVVQSGRELNTSAEGSFVPGSAIAPIETPKSRANADSILREREAQLSGNPLDNFQVAAKAEVEEEPKAYSTGQAISEGYRMISDIKRMQAGRTGRNAREVAREKALDNQAIGAVYSAMQQHLESKGYDPRLVDMLGTKQGGGFRTAEDIDRLFKIKSEGIEYQDENGPVQLLPDADWDLVFDADRIARAQALKSQKAAGGDSLKQQQDFANLTKSLLDARKTLAESPDDPDARTLVSVLTNRFKQLAGDDWQRAEFQIGQQQAADLLKYSGQKTRPDGKPAASVEDKTADQVLAENLSSGNPFIPVVKGTYNNGEVGFDDVELAKQFPGGKLIDGSFFAVQDSKSGQHQKYRVVNGKPVALFSNPPPESEEATPLDASIKEIEAKEAVANAESNKKRIQEIDREISALSSTFTERRESSFTPMGYSAPVSSRAKNKDELIRDKNRIVELKKLKASLQK